MSLDFEGIIVPTAGMDDATLISEIERFAKANKIEPKTVTRRAVGNSRLYGRLLEGHSCTLRIAAKLRDYMRSNRSPSASAPSEEAS